MLTRAFLATLTFFSVLGTASLAESQRAASPGRMQSFTTTNDGEARTYAVYVPASLASAISRPALFLLHGGGGSAQGMAALTGIQAQAAARGFVVVLPETPGGRPWDNGRPRPGVQDHDDAGFMRAVVAEVVASQRVAPSRIFIAGASSGGMMSMRMDCEAADLFAGVGVVAGLLPVELKGCDPSRALPLVMINGTLDDVIPFAGLEGRTLSWAETSDQWISANGCQSPGRTVPMPDVAQDGTTVTLQRAGSCERNVSLDFYVVQGGGHAWPGATRVPDRDQIARGQVISRDIDATATLVDSFERYGL